MTTVAFVHAQPTVMLSEATAVSTAPPRRWPAALAAVLLHVGVAAVVIGFPSTTTAPTVVVVELVMAEKEAEEAPLAVAPEPPAEPAPSEAAALPEPPPPEPEAVPEPEPEPEPRMPAPEPPPPKPTPRPAPATRPKPQPPRRDTATPVSSPQGQPGPATPQAEPALVPPSSTAAYLSNPRPAYPLMARRRGMQGVVILSVEVAADGHARTVTVKRSSGFEVLDEAAVQAVRGWRFVPGSRGGRAVEASVDVPIRFSLNDG